MIKGSKHSEEAKQALRDNNSRKRAENLPFGRIPDPSKMLDSVCNYCKKEFKYYKKNRTRKGMFCSRTCQSLDRTSNSGSYRSKALLFLDHTCQKCGKSMEEEKDIRVHHADENRANNDLDNLQIVCEPCHTLIHADLFKRSNKAYGDRGVQNGVILILKALKIDLRDKNFQATPQRVSRMFLEMFEGIFNLGDVKTILSTSFPTEYDGLIVHNGMVMFSMCPHHLLPVEYDISIAYLAPKTIGLSKLSRAVELLAKRPVLQETLTKDIADALVEHLAATAVLQFPLSPRVRQG